MQTHEVCEKQLFKPRDSMMTDSAVSSSANSHKPQIKPWDDRFWFSKKVLSHDWAALDARPNKDFVSVKGALPEGCKLVSLSEIPSGISLELSKDLKDDFWASLAHSKYQDGQALLISKDVKSETIHLVHELTEENSFFRLVIWLEEGAQVEVFQELKNGADGRKSLGLTQVVAGSHSRLKFISHEKFSENHEFVHRVSLEQGASSEVSLLPIFSGGESGQWGVSTEFLGSHSEFQMKGLLRAEKNQRIDFWSSINHEVKNCLSDQLFKVMIFDKAKSMFHGNIYVSPEAHGTKAFQKNKNMVLSSDGEAHAIPKLEIQTDELECAHGASVASMDPEELFYLQSRGIPQGLAEEMVQKAFVASVLEEISDEDLRDSLWVDLGFKVEAGE